MAACTKIFPKVFRTGEKQKICVKIDGAAENATVKIRIQGMERYTTPHKSYRIDEYERYPLVEMARVSCSVYELEYDFPYEEKYHIAVYVDDAPVLRHAYIYALDKDLFSLKALKGDTHMHSNRSDGEGTPVEVACDYRGAAYDFIAITDHHKMHPSVEAKAVLDPLTKEFTVFRGEEVHNHDMGYFHIVNFGGEICVNDIIENELQFVDSEVERIMNSTEFPSGVDSYACAYRIFVSEQIKRGGGLAIMAHPCWEAYGEYNMQMEDLVYLWKNGKFDALEVLAGCDTPPSNNGNNLQTAIWADLRAEGCKIPVLGASDAHSRAKPQSLFNKQFSIVFAESVSEIKSAIKDERSVAVLRLSDNNYYLFGRLRYVKYARFVLDEYFPTYEKLCKKHADALFAACESKNIDELHKIEAEISEYRNSFFSA